MLLWVWEHMVISYHRSSQYWRKQIMSGVKVWVQYTEKPNIKEEIQAIMYTKEEGR